MPVSGAVEYVWDEQKRAANVAAHGIDFRAAYGFAWDTARVDLDARRDYGEERFIAVGRIGLRIHVLIFTRRGDFVRIISLRKANRREIKRYEEGQTQV